MPLIPYELASMLLRDATALANHVQRDETGDMVAGQFVGGNGGNLSRETLQAKGRLQLTLNDIKMLPAEQKEG